MILLCRNCNTTGAGEEEICLLVGWKDFRPLEEDADSLRDRLEQLNPKFREILSHTGLCPGCVFNEKCSRLGE